MSRGEERICRLSRELLQLLLLLQPLGFELRQLARDEGLIDDHRPSRRDAAGNNELPIIATMIGLS